MTYSKSSGASSAVSNDAFADSDDEQVVEKAKEVDVAAASTSIGRSKKSKKKDKKSKKKEKRSKKSSKSKSSKSKKSESESKKDESGTHTRTHIIQILDYSPADMSLSIDSPMFVRMQRQIRTWKSKLTTTCLVLGTRTYSAKPVAAYSAAAAAVRRRKRRRKNPKHLRQAATASRRAGAPGVCSIDGFS